MGWKTALIYLWYNPHESNCSSKFISILYVTDYALRKKWNCAGNCGFGYITEEMLNGKLHVLCSVMNCWIKRILCKIFKSSHQRCFVRKDILRNFAKFKGKHLCQSLRPAAEAYNFIIKETLAQVFSYVSFAKFLRTPFLQNTSGRLLPDVLLSKEFQQSRWLLKSAKASIIDQHLFLEDYINFRAHSEP